MSERINKYLSAHGVCSRREADRMIQEGRITVDGRIADMGEMVEDNTIICVDGRKIDSSRRRPESCQSADGGTGKKDWTAVVKL